MNKLLGLFLLALLFFLLFFLLVKKKHCTCKKMGIRPPGRPAGSAARVGEAAALPTPHTHRSCLVALATWQAVAAPPSRAARRTQPGVRCLRAMLRHAN